jgi:ribosome-associated protein
MEPKDKALKIAKILSAKKAQDILMIHVSEKTILADYFIVASGGSTTLVKTLAEEVDFKMGQEGMAPLRQEGMREGRWAVLDYGDVLVHIFHNEEREFYQLERLWADDENCVKYED